MRYLAPFKWMLYLVRKATGVLPGSARDLVFHEILSTVGRRFSKPLRLDKSRANYVNLGCGPKRLDGFINIDFFCLTQTADYESDLRYPLRIDDETVAGIFTEHTLEHLSYAENASLLDECCRILKPGGVMRISVPDLSVFAKRYCQDDRAWFSGWERMMFVESEDPVRRKRRLISAMEAISFVTQEYGHRSCWDFEILRALLAAAGFTEIRQVSFRQGRDDRLLVDLDALDRKMVSMYVEAVKP